MTDLSSLSNRREDILRCAHTLILAGGYNSFSYADISKVVGIRNASIHHHFPTKADLVRTLVAQYREGVQTGIAQMEQYVSDPLEKLRRYIAYWEACIADGSIPFCLCPWRTSVFEQGEKAGSIRLTNTAAVEAELFMAVIHGAMLSARAYGDVKVFGIVTHPLLERLAP